jgi:hypothetical protein
VQNNHANKKAATTIITYAFLLLARQDNLVQGVIPETGEETSCWL